MIGRSLILKVHYARNNWWKNNRLIFPSPAEVQFVRMMGGKTLTLRYVTSTKTGFPLTIIVSMGRTLRREFVKREVRVGAMYIDFAFETKYSKKGIEIDGQAFHRDIVKEQERDEYCYLRGWKLLHIQAYDIYRRPNVVRKSVIKFLAQ